MYDPHGFEMARRKLEEVYPSLDYVATSSAGAAVGGYRPPYKVSPQQLTRAFLASRNADGNLDDINSLGKRILQAQHTGIWRMACRTLVDFFDDPANAGRGSKAEGEIGNPDWTHREHTGAYDRNLLLYVTIEAAIALEIDDARFSVAGTWERLCDHGNYLVPTTPDYYDTYSADEDADQETKVETFLPIVAYGSLELLRSSVWAGAGIDRISKDLFPEDLVRHVRRTNPQTPWLKWEAGDRYEYAPASMHARYCNAEIDLEINDCLGNPDAPSDFLWDIFKDERIVKGAEDPGISSANRDAIAEMLRTTAREYTKLQNGLGDTGTTEDPGPWMYAKATHFDAEVISNKYKKLNLNSHVYVTSSTDPSIPPGIHRLLDLNVFRRVDTCRDVPYAVCRTPQWGQKLTVTAPHCNPLATGASMVNDVTTAAGTVANTLLNVFPQFGRRMSIVDAITCKPFPTPVGKWYHTLGAAPEATQFMNGVELFTSSRYFKPLGQQNLDPNKDVFEGVDGCGGTFEPQNYMQYKFTQGLLDISIDELINRLQHPAPPPPVPPDSPSPPPPSPPPPSPPPSAPREYLRDELRELAYKAEEAFCTQVYWRTVDERCDELAIALTERYHVNELPPPSLPPQSPAGLPPPLPPPLAPLRTDLATARLAGATLSTLRRPDPHDPTRPLAEVYDGMSYASGESYDAAATGGLPANGRTRCAGGITADGAADIAELAATVGTTEATIASAVGPNLLPCVSAVRADNCLDGVRACDRRVGGSDDALRRNSVDPQLEVQLEAPPRFRRAFLHSVKLYLPQTYEFASLLFQSAEPTGGSGYRIEALRGDGSVAATASDPVAGVPDSRELEVLFAPVDDDAQVYRALADVLYVRLTLLGDFRQIWLKRVEVVEKTFDEGQLALEPPSPPPRPDSPPSPPESTATCSFAAGGALDDGVVVRMDFEGCGLSQDQCCKAAASSYSAAEVGTGALAFLLSDHQCCSTMIVDADAKSKVAVAAFLNFATDEGGVGFVD